MTIAAESFRHRFARAWARIVSTRWALLLYVAPVAIIALLENDLQSLPFTFLVAFIIAAAAYALTARPRFSFFMAFGLLSLSAAASLAKHKFLSVNAHVFDLRFYFSKSDTLAYLADDTRWLVLGALALLIGFITVAVVVFRYDRPARLSKLVAAGALAPAVICLPFALPAGAGELSYHFRPQHFASSFFVSLSDLVRLAQPDPLAERLAAAHDPAAPFPLPPRCAPTGSPPDIVLVLSESAVVPSRVPGWRTPEGLDALFRSYDGDIHGARVETHGGGTWISHTSALSGLSMADFGWLKQYVTMLLRGRIRHSLPMALQACGYKTALISPASFNFVNEGPMLKSLGIEDYLDRSVLKAPSKHEPDSFYFSKALDYYRSHRARDNRPLFLFVATMSAHMPYDARLEPLRVAKGEPFGNDAETDEYLRREIFAQEDYLAFVDALDKARGERPALVAQFGDHHPYITRAAFEKHGVELDVNNTRSPLFETFYSVRPLGFQPPVALPKFPALDLAYLGVTLMETAGLPLDPNYAEQRDLRDHCRGEFHNCADRSAVDRYLTRMVKAGQIVTPPLTSPTGAAAAGGS